LAAIIVATVPLWFVILDKRQWAFHFSNKQIIFGFCIGFAGVILLFSGKSAAGIFNDRMKVISLFVLLVGTICWTTGSLYAKYRKMEGSTIIKVAIQMIAAGVCSFIFALFLREQKEMDITAVTWESIIALLYLILIGS